MKTRVNITKLTKYEKELRQALDFYQEINTQQEAEIKRLEAEINTLKNISKTSNTS